MKLLTIIVAIAMGGFVAACSGDPEYIPANERDQQEQTDTSDDSEGNSNGSTTDNNSGNENSGDTDSSGSDWENQEGEGLLNSYRYVDLGLSVNWAIANLGAKDKPTSPGNLYKWGAISAISSSDGSVSFPNVNNEENIAATDYDAATSLYGAPWRMPTKAEIEELLSSCKVEWNINYGYEITASNGNSIFLPAAGYCDITSTGEYNYINNAASTLGCYWSATASAASAQNSAYCFEFSGTNWFGISLQPRYRACSIRPVCPRQ